MTLVDLQHDIGAVGHFGQSGRRGPPAAVAFGQELGHNGAFRPNAKIMRRAIACCLPILSLISGCRYEPPDQPMVAAPESSSVAIRPVDGARIAGADSEPGNWLSHGRTYDEQRFSPLDRINADNVDALGLAWYYDFPTRRGLEATPLVVDGVMYSTGSWSMVYAHDAASGDLKWMYNPQVPREWAVHLCCDVVNRGVAIWGDTVYSGTLDGRLLALDAASGTLKWTVQTTDPTLPYSITGAPRIIKGKVLIGNGGADFGVRGYLSAYDAASGKLAWRFYTVPGNPADGFESAAMEMAAATWTGEWWRYGGGGTVWDSMAYDPELDLLYIGTGNGAPWNRQIRSPGGGDNLFLSSIVALKPDTGAYVWHYQTTPGESWDYTATQHLILADLSIGGTVRKVIMQAPKNGFFYVLDRTTGAFISAEPFIQTTWASHIDPLSGRPVETPGARFEEAPAFALPGPIGAHSWHPMSYSPATGLVYLPAQEPPFLYAHDADFDPVPGLWNIGVDMLAAAIPEEPATRAAVLDMVKGRILAWDPVAQQEAWRVEHDQAWNGGLLSTAGNLVFQGNARGEFVAYRADTGERLWSAPALNGVVAAPVTYLADDEQYVSVLAGWGGVWPLVGGAALKQSMRANVSRILTFKLGGNQTLPAPPVGPALRPPEPPPLRAGADTIALGKKLYTDRCGVCHGDGAVAGGVTPDLRYLDPAKHAIWDQIVRDGLLEHAGMVGFGKYLDQEQTDAIHHFVIAKSHELYQARTLSDQ